MRSQNRWTVQISLMSMLFPGLAKAQGIVPCEGLDCKLEHLLSIPGDIFNMLITFAGAVALLFVVWGAVKMLLHPFSESPSKELEDAKFTISRALVGLVIVAASYLLVNTVIHWLSGGEVSIADIFRAAE